MKSKSLIDHPQAYNSERFLSHNPEIMRVFFFLITMIPVVYLFYAFRYFIFSKIYANCCVTRTSCREWLKRVTIIYQWNESAHTYEQADMTTRILRMVRWFRWRHRWLRDYEAQDATKIMQIRCKSRRTVTLIHVTILEVIGRQRCRSPSLPPCPLSLSSFLFPPFAKLTIRRTGNSFWRRSWNRTFRNDFVFPFVHIYERDIKQVHAIFTHVKCVIKSKLSVCQKQSYT